jgi:hypothetical protein
MVLYLLVDSHALALSSQSGEGACDSWWWEDEYAVFITGTGLNLLVDVAGGHLVLGRPASVREMMATATSTWYIYVIIMVAQALKMLHDRI